jgi:hypothetical protein
MGGHHLVPRNWQITTALYDAHKRVVPASFRPAPPDPSKRPRVLPPDSRKNKDRVKVTLPKFSWDKS